MAEDGTLIDLLQRGADYLAQREVANARREAEWIFAGHLGLSRLELYTRYDMPVAAAERDRLRAAIQRRGKREPLAYILGTQPFCGLELAVTPAVLVPRPETEELVELVAAELADDGAGRRVLDVGTGSGAIALALKSLRPAAAVHATELSPDALAVARGNAERSGLDATFHRGHLAQELEGGWDLVVANLPYVAESERALCDPELAFEPQGALFAADEGLALIAELIADGERLLAPGGALWLEHGFAQAARIADLAAAAGLVSAIHRDGGGHERFTRIARDG